MREHKFYKANGQAFAGYLVVGALFAFAMALFGSLIFPAMSTGFPWVVDLLGGIAGILMGAYILFKLLKNHITISQTTVIVPNDGFWGRTYRLQKAVKLPIANIVGVELVGAIADSEGNGVFGVFVPITNIRGNIMKRIKRFAVALLLLCSFGQAGCTGKNFMYRGESPALYSVALNVVLNANGYIIFETTSQPVVQVLETDLYGRVLFCYAEGAMQGDVALIVCQATDEQNAYYYPNICYLPTSFEEGGNRIHHGSRIPGTIDDPYNGVSANELDELKEINDWDRPLDNTKLAFTSIIRKRGSGPFKAKDVKRLFLESEVGKVALSFNERYSSVGARFSAVDADGRSLYYLSTGYGVTSYAVIIQADGTYLQSSWAVEVEDERSYQANQVQFKQDNGWRERMASEKESGST
jgi:hypothetical protein